MENTFVLFACILMGFIIVSSLKIARNKYTSITKGRKGVTNKQGRSSSLYYFVLITALLYISSKFLGLKVETPPNQNEEEKIKTESVEEKEIDTAKSKKLAGVN